MCKPFKMHNHSERSEEKCGSEKCKDFPEKLSSPEKENAKRKLQPIHSLMSTFY